MRIKYLFLFCMMMLACPPMYGQFGEVERKIVQGVVVNGDGDILVGVVIKNERDQLLGRSNAKGSFKIPVDVPLGGNTKPVLSFRLKGYKTKEYKYDYARSVRIVLESLEVKEEIVITPINEEKANEEVVVSAGDFSSNSTDEVNEVKSSSSKSIAKPKALEEIHEELDQNIEKVTTSVQLDKRELNEMKEYITYLETKLAQEEIHFNAKALGNSAIITQEVKKKIDDLKSEVAKKEKALKKSEKERKLLWWAIGAIVLILIPTILAIVFYRNNKKTKGLNVVLEEQVVQIQQQSEEISAQRDNILEQAAQLEEAFTQIQASIVYAQKIQESTLIKPSLVADGFQDLFVYFKPKDIVSGDFYWFASQDNKMILAAVDCTGHGVPGAFMTMLGQQLLNEIVNQKKITNPSQILKELHLGVEKGLHQTEADSAKDGMDIALVSVDLNTKKMVFAGANNPLYMVNEDEIVQIRGSKSGIGGEQTVNEFENHELDLSEWKSFYICSDGFQDQFGGKDGKKFMKGNFRKLLYSLSDKPAVDQKTLLEQELLTWMNDTPQTDDILVIGVTV